MNITLDSLKTLELFLVTIFMFYQVYLEAEKEPTNIFIENCKKWIKENC